MQRTSNRIFIGAVTLLLGGCVHDWDGTWQGPPAESGTVTDAAGDGGVDGARDAVPQDDGPPEADMNTLDQGTLDQGTLD